MKKLFFFAVVTILGAPLSLSAQQAATVHIYRNGSRGNAIQILVDGNDVFKLSNHEMVTFSLAPGYHEISARYAHQQPTVAIDAKASDERFLQLTIDVRRSAMFGITDPSNAVAVTLSKESGIVNADQVHEHPLSSDKLAAILASSNPAAFAPRAIAAGAPPVPPLTDEQVRDAILQGAHTESPGSIGLYLDDVQMNVASHALADGNYANSGFSVSIYTPEKWIVYQAAIAHLLMEPFTSASVTPEMRANTLHVVALPKVPDRLDGQGMSAASSVARVVLCDRSRQDVVQPLNEAPSALTVDSALRSKDYTAIASVFNMNEVRRIRAEDSKGKFFVVVIGQDGSRKFFDVKAKFAGWL